VNKEGRGLTKKNKGEGGIYDFRCTRKERLGKRGQKPYE
jgi:hypothetical protein